ncbi:cuticle protein 18.7-like [Cydia amplana]|uniref:cuticle protein 18.7-like n=1 Tax=Cydia amplana TaxID=1869771 RepID=UPI002FE510F1
MFKLVVLFASVALAAAKPGVLAPVAYSAAVPAVSSVSQYSSSVVHGSPVVPAVYSSAILPAAYSAAVVPAVAPAVVPAYGYGLSQAPHSPAVVLDAVNGVPLDTPEVVAARAAHYQAKALSGHHLRKRSVAAVAPVAYSSYVSPVSAVAYSSPVVSPYSSVVSPYSAVVSPVSYSALVPKAYSVHPW